jgi:hypothetical protein
MRNTKHTITHLLSVCPLACYMHSQYAKHFRVPACPTTEFQRMILNGDKHSFVIFRSDDGEPNSLYVSEVANISLRRAIKRIPNVTELCFENLALSPKNAESASLVYLTIRSISDGEECCGTCNFPNLEVLHLQVSTHSSEGFALLLDNLQCDNLQVLHVSTTGLFSPGTARVLRNSLLQWLAKPHNALREVHLDLYEHILLADQRVRVASTGLQRVTLNLQIAAKRSTPTLTSDTEQAEFVFTRRIVGTD